MKMGTGFKQAISTQHKRWNKSSEPTRGAYRNPLTFEKWFLICLRKCEKRGAEFTFLSPGLIRIEWPGKPAMLRTLKDAEREYQNEYLSKF